MESEVSYPQLQQVPCASVCIWVQGCALDLAVDGDRVTHRNLMSRDISYGYCGWLNTSKFSRLPKQNLTLGLQKRCRECQAPLSSSLALGRQRPHDPSKFTRSALLRRSNTCLCPCASQRELSSYNIWSRPSLIYSDTHDWATS